MAAERSELRSFRMSEAEARAYERAAERARVSLSEWMRLVLSAAAGATELPEQFRRVMKDEVRTGKW